MPNTWLTVTTKLAREVDPRDYIYDPDGPRGRRPRPHGEPVWKLAARSLATLVLGAALGQAVPWLAGYRPVGPGDRRLIEAVHRVDPRVERWSDEQLQRRLEYRREAMDLIEHTMATSSTTTYPYLSRLSSHPSPLVDPGAAPALLLLANALDQYPQSQRGHLVQAVVAAGVALGDPDLQATLQVLGDLKLATRRRLVANQAAGLKHMLADQLAYQDGVDERVRLRDTLSAERATLDAETRALSSAIEQTQRHQLDLSNADRRCGGFFDRYRACLVDAAQGDSTRRHD